MEPHLHLFTYREHLVVAGLSESIQLKDIKKLGEVDILFQNLTAFSKDEVCQILG